MKKLILIILAAMLLLTACGGEDTANTTKYEEHLQKLFTAERPDNADDWDEIMTYVINDVPRERWQELLCKMPWAYNAINTFGCNDGIVYGTDAWVFNGTELTLFADYFYFPEWSHNIEWDTDDPTNIDIDRTATVVNPNEDAYILILMGDYWYFVVEISPTAKTEVRCLANADTYFFMPSEDYAAMKVKEAYLANGEKLFDEKGADGNISWDPFLTYVTEEMPQEYWQELFDRINYWPFGGINTLNAEDSDILIDSSLDFANGEFTIHAESFHRPLWSSNVKWNHDSTDFYADRTASVVNPEEDAYILFLLGDYYFYLVEISPDKETALTCLAEEFVDQFYVSMPAA